jgi:signal peptide peptidase SppA
MRNPLLARFAGVPSLVAPMMAGRFEAALGAVMRHERAEQLLSAHAMADDGFWPAADDWRAYYRPYVVRDGMLHIPVKGVLLHDFPWSLGSWATGYIYIARALERGLADPMVRAIALICDSPGGEVAGCFELVDKIYAARAVKPIRAFAHESAYSAGFAVASAAEHIVVSRTGGVANIGVVTMHVDVSGAMDEAGIKITFIFSGKHKVDGNAYEALPADVKKRWQAQIDDLYGIFCASVARNRGMSDADVRATEALDYTAKEAVEKGLADSIGPLDDAVAAFNADLSQADEQGEDEMNDKTAAGATVSKETHDSAVTAARTEGQTAGKAEGLKEGATAERTRISAILGSDEAKDRGTLASHLAFETDMTADAAKAMLAKSAKEAKAPATATIEERTQGQGAEVALGSAPIKTGNAGAADGWDAAAQSVNKQFGVSPKH